MFFVVFSWDPTPHHTPQCCGDDQGSWVEDPLGRRTRMHTMSGNATLGTLAWNFGLGLLALELGSGDFKMETMAWEKWRPHRSLKRLTLGTLGLGCGLPSLRANDWRMASNCMRQFEKIRQIDSGSRNDIQKSAERHRGSGKTKCSNPIMKLTT